jgi:4-diphosphocytidyl-2-C-methyl-D-erythritol kinase
MISFPPCKINLGLNVIGKRADGFHDISTCFYPVQWTDVLEVIPSSSLSFSLSGIEIPGNADDNLCIRAYHLLRKDFDIPSVRIHLHKIIPTGAGLGGGSSDAAFTLRTLNEIFELKLSVEQIKSYAAQLGSDCSFFVQDGAMVGSGRGEILESIDLSLAGKFLVIVKPEIHVSTAEAYAGVRPATPDLSIANILKTFPEARWKEVLKNDFEASVFQKHPAIRSIKEKLYASGATYASMSGSGSSVFGIFESEVNLRNEFPDNIFWAGKL